MPDRRSRNFVKSTVFFYLARLLLLCTFYAINFTTLSFSEFLMVFLKKKTKNCYFFSPMVIPRKPGIINYAILVSILRVFSISIVRVILLSDGTIEIVVFALLLLLLL